MPTHYTRIELTVETQGVILTDTIEVPCEQWDAMTPTERGDYAASEACAFRDNVTSCGYTILCAAADSDTE